MAGNVRVASGVQGYTQCWDIVLVQLFYG
jgi:hypothetical protein